MKKDALKKINKIIDQISYYHNRFEVVSDIIEAFAIAISNKFDKRKFDEREETYKQIITKYKKDEQYLILDCVTEIFYLLANMVGNGFYDYLGQLYMESKTSNKNAGQFFTPYSVSQACAGLLVDDRLKNYKQGEILTLLEPSCGSGGMVLAFVDELNKRNFNYANNLIVDAADIDKRCVYMTYLQLSLAGVPAIVRHQDTLLLKQWDEWHTPALCMNYLRFRDYLNKSDYFYNEVV